MTFLDVTADITPSLLTHPGDPNFSQKKVSDLNEGNCFNLCEIKMGNHTGTHIDFPSHVIPDGKTSSDYSINDLVGVGVVIELDNKSMPSITCKFIKKQKIQPGDFVFFKTKNSLLSKYEELYEDYVFIDADAAHVLVNSKVRVVGIDYLSVDDFKNNALSVHHILLKNNVLIVENLELKNIFPGRYHVFIAPINIPKMDGLPTRVFLKGV